MRIASDINFRMRLFGRFAVYTWVVATYYLYQSDSRTNVFSKIVKRQFNYGDENKYLYQYETQRSLFEICSVRIVECSPCAVCQTSFNLWYVHERLLPKHARFREIISALRPRWRTFFQRPVIISPCCRQKFAQFLSLLPFVLAGIELRAVCNKQRCFTTIQVIYC